MSRFSVFDRFGRSDRFAPPEVRFVEDLARALPERTERIISATVTAKIVNAVTDGERSKAELRAMGLGSGKMAGSIVSGIHDAVQRAMTDARAQIGSATDELVAEIKSGAANVKRAIQAEAVHVREEFGQIVGNATGAAEQAITDAQSAIKPGG